jgi:UDP-2,3-diacylglucosamine pyrophosphatase LpxH
MKTSKLNVASISDIHLGAKRTPTRHILQNLRLAFPDNEETGALDLICLVGDVFDTLLSLNHEDLVEIKIWIAEFLRLCVKHGIKLYILEGTPSHDWWQSHSFSPSTKLQALAQTSFTLKTFPLSTIPT